jgi:type I restriction enzyme S subunit
MAGRKLTQALENHARLQASPLSEELPPGYKMTELGPLPEEWRVVRLGEIARVKYGKAKPTDEHGNIPVIGSGGIYGWTTEAVVDFPTLIIGRKGAAGQVWLSESPSWPSDTTFYLEWKSNSTIDIRFLYGWFLLNPLSGEHAKTTIPSLQRPDLENSLVPLPPLPEQRAIAHVLRTVQRAKEATERVIAALRELKKSLMRYLFTYGPVPVDQADHVPIHDTEIGPLPAHWRVVRLGEVIKRTQYGLSKRGHQVGRYPILRMNNIEDGKVKTNELQFVDLDPDVFENFRLKMGDILFNRTNSFELVGKTAIFNLEGDFVFASYLIRLEVDRERLIPEFGNEVLNWPDTQVRLKSLASRGVSQSNISATKLKRFSIPLPPLPEQQEIARILRAVDRKIEAEEARQRALEALFRTLLHDLMTARRRLPAEFISRFAEETDHE